MRTMTDRRWPRIAPQLIAAGLAALLLTSCGDKRSDKVAVAPTGPPPVATPVTPLTPAVAPEAPIPPETLAVIDTTLAAAKAFNAKALADLAGIETSERRIRDQAGRALDAARRGDGARVSAARADAEATHKGLADGLAAFRTTAADQQAAVTAAVALCAPPMVDPLAPAPTAGAVTKPAPVPVPAPVAPGAVPAPATG
ncbi:MAG: hypothetical protein KKB47_17325, partial [Alphaproteobacteria bacterium]|nr:hypothetical protein [Alphaproteobacteria bacterium]